MTKPQYDDPGNLTHDILDRLNHDRDRVALARLTDDGWRDVTLGQFHAEVTAVAKGLIARGISAGDRVALLSKTRYEWTVADYAIWWIGAISVPIYESSSAAQVRWILQDSGAIAAIVETPRHAELLAQTEPAVPPAQAPPAVPPAQAPPAVPPAQAPPAVTIQQVWTIADGHFDALAAAGAAVSDDDLETRRSQVTAASVATVIYTSGTTGRPKGCELTHGNFRHELAGASVRLRELFYRDDASTLLFLPLAHVFARIIQVGAIRHGSKLGHTADIKDLVDHLAAFQPTFILAVPRVFEKVFNAASNRAYTDGRGKIFDQAVKTSIAYSRALDDGKPSILLRLRHAAFEKLVYGKLRAALGGRADTAISGGAPLGDRLAHFYRGAGVNILEGYGLTETTAAITVNTFANQRIGTVGRALPDTELRVSADGELLVRGPQVFTRYRNNRQATAAVLDDQGWFATGDLGEIDDDGYVRITGRKKEILVTAGGKNVAPAILEDRLRAHPYISQALVVGDGKPFIGALITIDPDAWTGDIDDQELADAVQGAVDSANTRVSQAESIRKFLILSEDWTEESGHLTPSFKVKRHAIMRDFHDEIEGLYVR